MRKFTPEKYINPERYRLVSELLINEFRQRRGIFADILSSMPEMAIYQDPNISNLSEKDKINATIFAAPFLRGSIATSRAVNIFLYLISERPEWIKPKIVSDLGIEKTVEDIKHLGLGYKAQDIAKCWCKNSEILSNIGGDLRPYLNGLSNFYDAFYTFGTERAKQYKKPNLKHLGFHGLGSAGKVLTLILHMLMEQGLMQKFQLPISVDFHAVSIYLRTGALHPYREDGIFYTYSRILRDASLEYSPENDWNYTCDVSRATYQIGQFCPTNNIYRDNLFNQHLKCLTQCVLNDECSVEVDLKKYHKEGKIITPGIIPIE